MDVRRFGFQSWDDGTRLYRARQRPGHPQAAPSFHSVPRSLFYSLALPRSSLLAEPCQCSCKTHPTHRHFALSVSLHVVSVCFSSLSSSFSSRTASLVHQHQPSGSASQPPSLLKPPSSHHPTTAFHLLLEVLASRALAPEPTLQPTLHQVVQKQ